MQDEEHIQRLRDPRIRLVAALHLEQHREEVLGVVELVVGIDIREAHAVAIGPGREGGDLGDQPDRRHVALLRVVDVLRVRIEGRERADVRQQHAHRVGVVAESLVQLLDVLVGEGVVGDVVDPALELGGRRELAKDQEVSDLEVGGVLAELLDGDAAVLEDSLLAVDEGDRRTTGGGVGEGRVVAHEAEVVIRDLDLAKIHRLDGSVVDLDLVELSGPVVGDAEGVAGGRAVPVGLRLCLGLVLCRQSGLLARGAAYVYAPYLLTVAISANRPSKEETLRLFSGLPRRYDLAGALFSFGQDPRWRRAMVREIHARPGDRVLDVATGTGMVAQALVRRYGCTVVGLDQSPEMLSGAQAKLDRDSQLAARIELVRGEAESLPFGDAEFDHLTFTYLLRYVADPGATLRELARVLKPGGRIASLEFGVPRSPALRPLWKAYTRLALPAIGRVVSREWYDVGRFLGPSILGFEERYPDAALRRLWAGAGIRLEDLRRLSFGAGVVICGVREVAHGA